MRNGPTGSPLLPKRLIIAQHQPFAHMIKLEDDLSSLGFGALERDQGDALATSLSDLREADLREADCSDANLREANLCNAALSGTQFAQAQMGWTSLSSLDLSMARSLDKIHFEGPCNSFWRGGPCEQPGVRRRRRRSPPSRSLLLLGLISFPDFVVGVADTPLRKTASLEFYGELESLAQDAS